MAEYKHLVIVEFKEGVAVDEIVKGMENLVSQIDAVKTFEWGQDTDGQEMLRQGFTHVFSMTFQNKDDFTAFLGHPNHVGFSATFSSAIKNTLVLDFHPVLLKIAA